MKKEEPSETYVRYCELVENLSVGVYRNTSGPQGRFLEANSAMLKIFEADSKKDFLKCRVSDVYQNPEERDEFIAEITKKGKVKNREINLLTLKGRKFVGAVTAVMKKDPKGNVFYDGIVDDVSERKEMEKKFSKYQESLEVKVGTRTQELEETQRAILNVMADLKELSARDEAILAGIAEGVVVVDRNGFIVLMNLSAEELLGWKVHESIGKKWFEIFKREDEEGNPIPPDEGAIKSALVYGVITPSSMASSYYYLRKNGTRFPVSRAVSPIVTGKRIVGAVNVFHDISLEKEVDRMKTEFVSLASHQLRTPLTAIKWNLEMILDKNTGVLNSDQEKYLSDISKSNDMMIGLVNSLLNISRIESGRLNIEPKLTNLVSLFRAVVEKSKPRISQNGLKLVDKIPKDLNKLEIDARLISNVYQNLMDNSIKYTPLGGAIEISIARVGKTLVSTIKDSGKGIPTGDQKNIFRRFFRGSNVSETMIGSTGLGLYLAKEIVEASGGKIWFESTEGKGSTFSFSLPLKGSPTQKGEVTLSA